MGWKENQIARYWKIRNNPKLWANELKKHRDRYKKVGHKKFKSECLACGKIWMGVAKVRRFCSQKCVSGGSNNGRWNGGKYINKQGYVLIWSPKSKSRYELEHRLIMEKHINRKLLESEDVHHKNHIKTDNRLENLKLMSTSEHTKLHWKEKNK